MKREMADKLPAIQGIKCVGLSVGNCCSIWHFQIWVQRYYFFLTCANVLENFLGKSAFWVGKVDFGVRARAFREWEEGVEERFPMISDVMDEVRGRWLWRGPFSRRRQLQISTRVRRGYAQVPRVRHPRTSTKPSTFVTGLLRYSGPTAGLWSERRCPLFLPFEATSRVASPSTRKSSRVGPKNVHRDTEAVAAGPDEGGWRAVYAWVLGWFFGERCTCGYYT